VPLLDQSKGITPLLNFSVTLKRPSFIMESHWLTTSSQSQPSLEDFQGQDQVNDCLPQWRHNSSQHLAVQPPPPPTKKTSSLETIPLLPNISTNLPRRPIPCQTYTQFMTTPSPALYQKITAIFNRDWQVLQIVPLTLMLSKHTPVR
jgi:hypothetical protein